MGKDPAFLFYPADAAQDVSHMNRLERGCYFDLIQAQKKFGGFTTEQARKILGKDFEECWNSVQLILECENETWFIPWVKESIQKRKEHSEKQRKRIQDYWDNEKNSSDEIPRNDDGISTDIPLENEIENENRIEIKKEKETPVWKTSFPAYLLLVSEAKQKILSSPELIQRRILNIWPNLDVEKTLSLSIQNFWGAEIGWKNKKKCKSKEIDMVETLLINIGKNKVFLPFGQQRQGSEIIDPCRTILPRRKPSDYE